MEITARLKMGQETMQRFMFQQNAVGLMNRGPIILQISLKWINKLFD